MNDLTWPTPNAVHYFSWPTLFNVLKNSDPPPIFHSPPPPVLYDRSLKGFLDFRLCTSYRLRQALSALCPRWGYCTVLELFTWREEYSYTRKSLEGGRTFRWVYMQKSWSVPLTEEKESKSKGNPFWPVERPPAIFVLFVPSTRIFIARAVYMVLGSS